MNIKFADEETFDRYVEYSHKTIGMERSLDKCMAQLMRWHPHDHTMLISRDFHDMSFFFCEKDENGRNGICGGIIFHGKRDNGGDGSAPTFSCCLNPTDGYSIHT